MDIIEVLNDLMNVPNYDPLTITSWDFRRIMITLAIIIPLACLEGALGFITFYYKSWILFTLVMTVFLVIIALTLRICHVSGRKKGIYKITRRMMTITDILDNHNNSVIFKDNGLIWKVGSLGAWIELHLNHSESTNNPQILSPKRLMTQYVIKISKASTVNKAKDSTTSLRNSDKKMGKEQSLQDVSDISIENYSQDPLSGLTTYTNIKLAEDLPVASPFNTTEVITEEPKTSDPKISDIESNLVFVDPITVSLSEKKSESETPLEDAISSPSFYQNIAAIHEEISDEIVPVDEEDKKSPRISPSEEVPYTSVSGRSDLKQSEGSDPLSTFPLPKSDNLGIEHEKFLKKHIGEHDKMIWSGSMIKINRKDKEQERKWI